MRMCVKEGSKHFRKAEKGAIGANKGRTTSCLGTGHKNEAGLKRHIFGDCCSVSSNTSFN